MEKFKYVGGFCLFISMICMFRDNYSKGTFFLVLGLSLIERY